MGEMADYLLNGDDCEGCGEYLGDGPGYPRRCTACGGNAEAGDPFGAAPRKRKKKLKAEGIATPPARTKSQKRRATRQRQKERQRAAAAKGEPA